MKIKDVRAFEIDFSKVRSKPKSTVAKKSIYEFLGGKHYLREGRQPAGPMERFPKYRKDRGKAGPKWGPVACVVEAEDGTVGVGTTVFSGPVIPIINEHYRSNLVGEHAMATEKLYDMMMRLSAAYGSQGVTSYAISAVDLALWDLKGKLLGRPVYELLGGPQKDKIFCYATGFDVDWYLELGFRAIKLPMPYGPMDGIEGLRKAEALVAETRERIGDDIELMLDCWMALDVEYTVRLAEVLKPYRLKWIEDYLMPDDMDGFEQVRHRVPGQGLATGEHWYLAQPFSLAAERRLVDIFQPDPKWVGGVSACVRICHIAEGAGLSVIPHGGMNDPFGQHIVCAMPAATWGERSAGVSPPGVSLAEMVDLPGTAVIEDGYLVPSDAPGFGIDVDRAWLEKIAV